MEDFRKFKIALILGGLVLGTLGLGLVLKQPFVWVALAVWAVFEILSHENNQANVRKSLSRAKEILGKNRSPFPMLSNYYQDWTPSSLILLEEEIGRLKKDPELIMERRKELERFSEIIELRKLLTLPQSSPKRKIRQLFVLNKSFLKHCDSLFVETLSPQDIIEAATLVAHLYQKVNETAENHFSFYQGMARETLLQSYKGDVPVLTNQIQQHSGISFLLLNFIKSGDMANARILAQRLLKEEWDIDEDLRSALYWLAELLWFNREMTGKLYDYETSMRYLYHLCFTSPERAHFLEIDSQYFSQFEVVNELAREAFLFRENLVHRFLDLWETQEGIFDGFYQEVLEVMTQLKSKIYDDRITWKRVWDREAPRFSKDYLYVVEGNLCYSTGRYEESRAYYEKALKENPNLRSALLNSVFAYAKLGERALHGWMVDRILNLGTLHPSNLYVAGNSCLLVGQDKKSDEYYSTLAEVPGWAEKVHLYRSTFCFENRLFEKALLYARLAERDKPGDSSILYHLSLCYSAVGEKERALEIVRKLEDRPHWLDYYRFTLERDAGKAEEATETLLTMPPAYFEDPEELEAALEFARRQKDLRLLRHLRNK